MEASERKWKNHSNDRDRTAGSGMKSRGRPSASDSAATRNAILQSARRLFAENGFEGTSKALVAQDAGLSPSAPYYRTEQQLVAFRKIVDIAVAAGEVSCGASSRDDLAELLRAIVVGWTMQYMPEPGLRIQHLPALLRFLQSGLEGSGTMNLRETSEPAVDQ